MAPTRFRLALVALLAPLVFAACDSPDSRAAASYALDAETAAQAAEMEARAAERQAAEQARQDSIARVEELREGRLKRPDSMRALYVNAWAVGSRDRMEEFIRLARETEINALVLDIKESDTYLTYPDTEIALARQIGAHERPASQWLPELVERLNEEGIYSIARIVVFKDAMLAQKRPDLAIRSRDGSVWRDRQGNPWVDPYNRDVWQFNIDIAREALEMGFSELQWDYVRFPDVPTRFFENMVFDNPDGLRREEAIRDFIVESRRQLAEFGVPVTADIFGLVTHVLNDLGIGQQWETLTKVTDALLPMVYPSHYPVGSYGIQRPNASPYQILRASMEEAVQRNAFLKEQGHEVAEIIPWLQAFSAPWVDDIRYGASHLREQIQATYDAGLTSWVLWHPGSRYAPYYAAFRGANGELSELERGGWQATQWTPPAGRLSPMVARNERQRQEIEAALDAMAIPTPAVARPAPQRRAPGTEG
jgi:hypothetical protein